jgi:pimeloyl-ACP methyl ester carboxylesterase
MRRRDLSTGEIVTMLEDRFEGLVATLYPGAKIAGGVAYPAWKGGDDLGSFQIFLTTKGKNRRGHWRRYSQGIGGSPLNLIRYWQTGETDHKGSYGEAVAWAKRWLGIDDSLSEDEIRRIRAENDRKLERQHRKAEEDAAAEAKRTREHVAEILAGTVPLSFDPADAAVRYAGSRGFDLAELQPFPPALDLRFAPALKYWGGRDHVGPALVAVPISARPRPIPGLHATFVRPDGSGKMPFGKKAKLMRGDLQGAFLPLSNGPGNLSFRARAEAGKMVDLVIAEGIETAIALAVSLPECAVWAALNLENIRHVPAHHPAVGRIIVSAENDVSPQATGLLDQILEDLAVLGKSVTTMRSPIGSDFADCFQDV